MSKRLGFYIWLLPAFIILDALIITAVFFDQLTTVGLAWTMAGEITNIAETGPAIKTGLRVGDQIVKINDCLVERYELCRYYIPWKGADVSFTVQRGDSNLTSSIEVSALIPEERFTLIAFLILASIFWVSSLVLFIKYPKTLEVRLFYALCQIAAAALLASIVVYSVIPFGPPWLHFLNDLLAPLIFHFHSVFPEENRMAKKRWPIWILYVIGFLLALISIFRPWITFLPLELTVPISKLWSVFGFLSAVVLVGVTYFKTRNDESRRKIRLIMFGAFISFIPVAIVLANNSGFGANPWVQLPFLIPLIGAVPVSYSIAMWRYNLLKIDQALNRGLVYLLISMLFFGVYLTALISFYALLPSSPAEQAILGAIVALLAAITFRPLRRWVEKGVDRLFYGGWYDYRSLQGKMGQALATAHDVENLIDILINQVPKSMQLPGAMLWLANNDKFTLAGASTPGVPKAHAWLKINKPPKEIVMNEEYAIVPLLTKDKMVGVWALAARRNANWDPNDKYIFSALARQAALTENNLFLLAGLREKIAEAEKAHQRLLAAREEERADLARELHDGVIQDLIGLRYRLEALQEQGDISGQLGDLHAQLGVLVNDLIRLCSNLRPPSLDQLGLAAALRALAREFSERGIPVETYLEDLHLPNDVATSLYRISQEALSNAWRHAKANKISIHLRCEANEVFLTISDDGIGFNHYSVREKSGRFGLINMAERAQTVGGYLDIQSTPGEGTQVLARINLQNQIPRRDVMSQ